MMDGIEIVKYIVKISYANKKCTERSGFFFSTGSWEFALWYYRAWVNVRHNLLDKIPTLGKHRICMRVYKVYGLRQHLLIY